MHRLLGADAAVQAMNLPSFRIIALDGALNCSGWCCLTYEGKTGEIQAEEYGLIKTRATMELGFKLLHVRQEFLRLLAAHMPDMIVFEDTYSGVNRLTTARLNNAKGVFVVTAREYLGSEPVLISPSQARKCLGFKNNKDEPFAYFTQLYGLTFSFAQGNDITDSLTLGHWYIRSQIGGCVKPKRKKSSIKRTKANASNKR